MWHVLPFLYNFTLHVIGGTKLYPPPNNVIQEFIEEAC